MNILPKIRQFKQKLLTHSVSGPFSKTCDSGMVEVMGHAGFDFVILDTEHGPSSTETLQNHIRACASSDMLPIVRVPGVDAEAIGKALDCQAGGVQVPNVKSAEQVRSVIQAAKFAPLGQRGVCRYVRAAEYSSQDKSEYFKQANEALVIIQVEGQEAIENLQEIISVPGVDIIFIGPYDLSQSLGVAGETQNPKVIAKMKEIVNACKAKNILVGTFTETQDEMKFWAELGVAYISISVDVGLFYQACRQFSMVFNQHLDLNQTRVTVK